MDDDIIILSLLEEGIKFIDDALNDDLTDHDKKLLNKYQLKYVVDDEIFDDGAKLYTRYILQNGNSLFQSLINYTETLKIDLTDFYTKILNEIYHFAFNEQMELINQFNTIDFQQILLNELASIKNNANYLQNNNFFGNLIKKIDGEEDLDRFVNFASNDKTFSIFSDYSITVFNLNIMKITLSTKPGDNKNINDDKFLSTIFKILLMMWGKLDDKSHDNINESYLFDPSCKIKWFDKYDVFEPITYSRTTYLFFLILQGLRVGFIPTLYRAKKWNKIMLSLGQEISRIMDHDNSGFLGKLFLEKLYEELSYVESIWELDKKIVSDMSLINDIDGFYHDFINWVNSQDIKFMEEDNGLHDYLSDMSSFYISLEFVDEENNSNFEQLNHTLEFLSRYVKTNGYIHSVNLRFQILKAFFKIVKYLKNEEKVKLLINTNIITFSFQLYSDIYRSDLMIPDKIIINNTIQTILSLVEEKLSLDQIRNISISAYLKDRNISECFILNVLSGTSDIYDLLDTLNSELKKINKCHGDYLVKANGLLNLLILAEQNMCYIFDDILLFFSDDKLLDILSSKHIITSICLFLNSTVEILIKFLKRHDDKIVFKFLNNDEIFDNINMDHDAIIEKCIMAYYSVSQKDFMKYIISENYKEENLSELNNIRPSKDIEIIMEKIKLFDEKDDEYAEDIPDEFLDPLTFNIIEDPVYLPDGSGQERIIIDKANIIKCIMEKGENPFTRDKLTVKELEEYNNKEDIKNKLNGFREKFKSWANKNKIK